MISENTRTQRAGWDIIRRGALNSMSHAGKTELSRNLWRPTKGPNAKPACAKMRVKTLSVESGRLPEIMDRNRTNGIGPAIARAPNTVQENNLPSRPSVQVLLLWSSFFWAEAVRPHTGVNVFSGGFFSPLSFFFLPFAFGFQP